MKTFKRLLRYKKPSGQSLVELALIVPLLLLMLAGMVEIAFLMFTYMSMLDQTREAARFASVRDYDEANLPSGPSAACTDGVLHYYYDTACFFTDPNLNHYVPMDASRYDDVVITVYTVANNHVSQRHPAAGYWSLNGDNWKKDCQGNVVRTTPDISNAYIESKFAANAPTDRGIVSVEAWVCYDAGVNLPFISDFIPNPVRLHVFTIMPAPAGLPTPTSIPTP